MQTRLNLWASAFALAAVVLCVGASPNDDASPQLNRSKGGTSLGDDALASIRLRLRELGAPKTAQEEALVRVTAAPFHINRSGSELCRAPNSRPSNPHGGHWIDVYVTQAARAPILSGKGVYPAGSVILKQKLIDAAGTKTDLYTGMLKREKGYNPQVGDWEFFVLDGKATTVKATGKLRSCIGCHEAFSKTDFVSRRYLTDKVAVNR